SISTNGVLAYRAGAAAGLLQPNWFDRGGKLIAKAGEPAPDRVLVLSPDATHAAGRDEVQSVQGDIWVTEFSRDVRTRVTFRRGPGSVPVWSPDGKRILFSAGGAGGGAAYLLDTIYEKSAGGADTEKELLKTNELKVPTSVSSDGRFLLYYTTGSRDTGS